MAKMYTKKELDMAVKKAVAKLKLKKGGSVRRKKRPMNAFMKAKEKARKSGASSFTYKGKTYRKKKRCLINCYY